MSINRRDLIRRTIKGGVILYTLPLVAGCSGTARGDMAKSTGNSQWEPLVGRERAEMLHLASLAPNGHNTQPWMVTIVNPDHWIIGSDPDRWLPAVDPDNHDLLVSIGAFLENLEQAATCYGYQAEITVTAMSAKALQIAEVRLHKAAGTSGSTDPILSRCTVRNNLLKREIAGADIRYITGDSPNSLHYFTPGSRQSTFLNQGTIEANRLQTYRDTAQEELADWIRWSNGDIEKHRDGFNPASMGITGFAGLFVRLFFDRNSVLKEDFRKSGLAMAEEQVNQHGGWIVLTGQGDDPGSYIESGRNLQKMLLKIRRRNIALHPMTQILQEGDWQNRISDELGLDASVHLVLRAGYLEKYPDPVSVRRPVEWFVKSA